jgi:DNA polymerase I
MAQSRGTLILIDGSNNLYRSYFAIRGLTNSAGLATNAVYGFTQTLRKLIKDYKPAAIGVAFDIGKATFRHKLYDGYKKDRKPMPDDLRVQVPLVNEVCEGFRIPILTSEDYEADDLIGALARRGAEAGWDVVIATSDKDFFQLVGGKIRLYHTGREKIYDAEEVEKDYGLPPSKVVDVMAIWGDTSDSIPGVKGIGEKGAKDLIREFGSLDGVYENLDRIGKPAQRKKLEESKDDAYLSRELATIRDDVKIGIDLDSLVYDAPDTKRLHDLFARLEFSSLLAEYLPDASSDETTYRRVESAAEIESLASSGTIAIGVESSDRDGTALDILSLAVAEGSSLVVPLAGAKPEVLAALRSLFGGRAGFVVHDAKRLHAALDRHGLAVPAALDDTMLESYVLNPGAWNHDLATLAREKLARAVTERKEVFRKQESFSFEDETLALAAEPADLTWRLHTLLSPELAKEPELGRIYRDIEMPLVPILHRMEEAGIRIDTAMLEEMSSSMATQLEALERAIYEAAGGEFNINSPAQLGTILFEKMSLPVLKKTAKTKSWSTGQDVLEELASMGHVVPRLILEHRELHKLKSTYVDALPKLVDANGRIHTTFNQAVAATGRLSSSDPNLQNIPVRTEQGRQIRKAFVAEAGCVLLAADYSQIELRVLAHMCGDEALVDAFRRGVDIHKATAAKIFNVAEGLVNPEQRRASKTINFGVLYGMSSFRLSNELGISRAEAKDFIDAYFSRYPKIRKLLDATLEEARATGKVRTLSGRIRYIPEIHNKSFTVRSNAERMATNAPIQGTAADLLKLAMIALDEALRREVPDARMLLTVHDEIVIEVPEARAETTADLVRTTMENETVLDVPLKVDTGWGRSWYEARL